MDRNRHHTPFSARLLILLSLSLAIPGMTRPGHAFEGKVEISSGYDDNVTETPDGDGFGFAEGRFESLHPLLSESAPVQAALGLEGLYREYFRQDHRYRTNAFARLSTSLWDNRLYPALTLGAGIYRNAFIPEDDADWMDVALHIDVLITARMTLGVEALYTRSDFRAAFLSEAARSRRRAGSAPLASFTSGNQSYGNNGSGAGMDFFNAHRNDDLTTTRLTGNFFLHPLVTATITLDAGENRSTVRQKTYDLIGASTGLTWKLNEALRIEACVSFQRSDYDPGPGHLNRRDDTWKNGIVLSRKLSMFEFFLQLDWIENDSNEAMECYTKRVMQCGLAYLF